MAYIGQAPTKVPLTSADIADGSIANVDIAALDASKLTGSIADARVPESAVTQHVAATDLVPVRQDINALALYNAVTDNRAAYNLPYSFIDHFQDSTGITTTTTVERNASEYVAVQTHLSPTTAVFSSDANTLLLLHMEGADLPDSSSNTHTTTLSGDCARSTVQNKFGTYSMLTTTGGLTMPDHAQFDFGTGDFTVEGWVYWNALNTGGSSNPIWDTRAWGANSFDMVIRAQAASVSGGYWEVSGFNSSTNPGKRGPGSDPNPLSTWIHYAVSRTSGVMYMFKDGVKITDHTNDYGGWVDGINWVSQAPAIGIGTAGLDRYANAYYDEFRVSNVGRYTADFTPNGDAAYTTGTLISDTQTASVATTKMSGVILYKDNAGTATLGTHLKIYLSANGGSNWTEAASYGAVTPVFSTGVKMVRLGETSVTSGTTPVMKAVWASQVASSLETQLHGWAMNY